MLGRRRSYARPSPSSGTARAAALRVLNRRDYSIAEMTRYLVDRGYLEDEVQATVASLRSDGLVDDDRTGRAHARTSALVKGRGRHRIRRELEARGLDRATIESAVSDLSPEQEHESLQRIIARNLRGQPLDQPAERRLYQRLLRRGFDSSDIRVALERAKAGADQ